MVAHNNCLGVLILFGLPNIGLKFDAIILIPLLFMLLILFELLAELLLGRGHHYNSLQLFTAHVSRHGFEV